MHVSDHFVSYQLLIKSSKPYSTPYGILISLAHYAMISVFLTLPLPPIYPLIALHSSSYMVKYLPRSSNMPLTIPSFSNSFILSTTSLVGNFKECDKSQRRVSFVFFNLSAKVCCSSRVCRCYYCADSFDCPSYSTENISCIISFIPSIC